MCSWAAVSGLPFEAAYTGSRVCACSVNTCFTHSLGIKVTHSHTHTGSHTHLHTIALGTRKWPRPLNQPRQWQKKQHTFWSQTHTFRHTEAYACTHSPKSISARSLPPTMQQDKWANHWVPVLPRVQGNQDYYPAPILHLCLHLCVRQHVPVHAWLGSMREPESVCIAQLYPQWKLVALSTSYLAVLSSRKTTEREGQTHLCQVWLRTAAWPSVYLLCLPQGYWFVKL